MWKKMKSTFFGENPIFFGDDIEVNPAMQQFPLNANLLYYCP